MKTILFLWLFSDFTLSAKLIEIYQTTQFAKKPNTLYALQSIQTKIPDYQNKIRTEIFKEIASQIQVLVNTTTTSSTSIDHDVYTSHFHEHSVLITKGIPLYNI